MNYIVEWPLMTASLAADARAFARVLTEIEIWRVQMLKTVLLASAMTIATPVLAQSLPAPAAPATVTGTAPAQTDATPAQDSTNTPAGGAMATEAVPPSDPQVAQTAPAQDATAPAETVAAAPANKAEQVAAVVKSEFPIYDKNADGKLSNAEFGAWMVALKTASDPATKADSPATRTWIGQAFASADTDRSKSVTESELNGFLSQG